MKFLKKIRLEWYAGKIISGISTVSAEQMDQNKKRQLVKNVFGLAEAMVKEAKNRKVV